MRLADQEVVLAIHLRCTRLVLADLLEIDEHPAVPAIEGHGDVVFKTVCQGGWWAGIQIIAPPVVAEASWATHEPEVIGPASLAIAPTDHTSVTNVALGFHEHLDGVLSVAQWNVGLVAAKALGSLSIELLLTEHLEDWLWRVNLVDGVAPPAAAKVGLGRAWFENPVALFVSNARVAVEWSVRI